MSHSIAYFLPFAIFLNSNVIDIAHVINAANPGIKSDGMSLKKLSERDSPNHTVKSATAAHKYIIGKKTISACFCIFTYMKTNFS